jgi:UDPglucose--hexose-1-phosphate uridylyltransferase
MDSSFDLQQQVHQRRNPLTGEWILVSPQRTGRPWQGQLEAPTVPIALRYDASCYLCPGNSRAGGQANPAYSTTFVFDNDFAALKADAAAGRYDGGELLQARGESGICRVICHSPRHNDTLGNMSTNAVRCVVDTWVEQYAELGATPLIQAVTIFENRGAMMGASSPHPHGQVWANATVPNELVKESTAQLAYREGHGSCLLCDYLGVELNRAERLVTMNDGFVALVPFWAIWPFETLVLPRQHSGAIDGLDSTGRDQLAAILKDLTARYDALFGVAFPYSMGLHQRPTTGSAHAHWHWHAHFYPPLLRSATVRKFMVGYELLAAPQRDITPEAAAERLRGAGHRPDGPAVATNHLNGVLK